MFQRRKQIMQIEGRRLGTDAFDGGERNRFAGGRFREPRAPFAVAPIEGEDLGAILQPQDIAQVIGLRRAQRDARAWRNRRVDIKAGDVKS